VKRIFNVLALTLAVNFLAVIAAVAWLYSSGRLDAPRANAIREILFPPPAPPQGPATQPASANPPSRAVLRLEELLAKTAGRPASEQLEAIRGSLDAQAAQLDHAYRKLLALQQQVDAAQAQVKADRADLDADRKALETREREAQRLATDKGFADSLSLYQTLPAKQVKSIFMGLEDPTIIQYLQAMDPRTAAKITKEFKSPEEVERLKKLMEQMRQASAGTPAPQPRSADQPPAG
jgi:hypothetical protein